MKTSSSNAPFLDLLEENKLRILRFCTLYTDRAEDREDLFQEIVFHLWRALPSFRGEARVATWIYRIALRVSTRFAERTARSRHRRVRLDGLDVEEAPAARAGPDVERREEVELLSRCISRLGPVDRALIALHLEGLSHGDIAATLGITNNHVAVKLKRIRARLLDCMETRS